MDATRRLEKALDAIAEPSHASGSWPSAALALVLPDGERCAVGDPRFVEWLLAHAEPAPFGDGETTRLDPGVRSGARLRARGATIVEGFAPQLADIERILSPHCRLRATLTDVLIYPAGGKFTRHKDTPISPALVGTLIVALPIAHIGGALGIDDGRDRATIDWGGQPDPGVLPWVALFGDVDHEVRAVRDGTRVTLTYTLEHEVLVDGRRHELAAVSRAVAAMLAEPTFLPKGGELLVPCSRQAIVAAEAPPDRRAAQLGLRGLDRELADLFESLGYPVEIRPCLAVVEARGAADHSSVDGERLHLVVRLREPLRKSAIGKLSEMVILGRSARGDDGPMPATSLGRYLLHPWDDIAAAQREAWVTRRAAAATMIHEAEFSADGDFGNEHVEAWLYTIASLEIALGPFGQRVPEPRAPAEPSEPRRVRHAKFGEGVIIATQNNGRDTIHEIRFDSGEVKKLVDRFVEPL
jgi:hypothetical protein